MTSQKAGKIFSENMRTIYLWSLHKVFDPYIAEDLCGDIILAVMESAPRLKNDDAFFAFLWGVAANTYKHFLRKSRKAMHCELDENIQDYSDPISDLHTREQTNALRRELAFLSMKYRICTVSYYYDGMSIKEISEKYGISPETVKFNLFQSRKIIKEGIAMERQFGEKSFKPEKFHFTTIVNGNGSEDFNNLFNRQLPGQILLSAYYEPMTVEQLSIELGVANVYLEDEVKLLMNYGFLKKHGERKYQTNIVILTKGYIDAIFDRLDEKYSDRIYEIIDNMRSKLKAIRAVNFTGCALRDELILWDLYAYLCLDAIISENGGGNYKPLYDKTTGVCYAYGFDFMEMKYPYQNFSGTYYYNGHHGRQANFYGHRQHEGSPSPLCSDEIYNGDHIPVFEKEELCQVKEIISDEFESMRSLVSDIAQLTLDILKEHSPECAYDLIDAYCPHITLWNLVGWFGGVAERTGALEKPKADELAGGVAYKNYPW